MATLPRVAPLWLIIGLVGGCSSGGGGGGEDSTCAPIGGPATDGAMIGRIDYQVLGGFSGGGDGTSLQIQPDGSLTRHTVQRGTEQGQLDQATLDNLVRTIRAAQFPTLCAMYPCAHCADEYVYHVSVQFNGNALTTAASEFAAPPDRLQAVIDALQQIVDRPL